MHAPKLKKKKLTLISFVEHESFSEMNRKLENLELVENRGKLNFTFDSDEQANKQIDR